MKPTTGESWIFAGPEDGLCNNSGLAFTPDGGRLWVINLSTSTVIEFTPDGNGTVIYDAQDGLRGPFGGNGLAWDRAGNYFVANEYSQQILRFSPRGGPPDVLADRRDGIGGGGGLALLPNRDALFASDDLLRITPVGVVSIFDPFFSSSGVDARSLVVDQRHNVYVAAVHLQSQPGKVHIYPEGNADSRRVIAEGYSTYNWLSIALSEDETQLYVVDNLGLHAVDLATFQQRTLLGVPPDPNALEWGRGIAVYKAPRPGDLNCDNWVNNFDIDPFVLALTDEAGYAARFGWCDRTRADVNRDGTIDNFDIDAFVAAVIADRAE
ncbi:MAG: hypothetical protein JNG88_18110 [Phycisphaerales bacterium]|nr:hypothetical protein [Phycisphaerales bacterium]